MNRADSRARPLGSSAADRGQAEVLAVVLLVSLVVLGATVVALTGRASLESSRDIIRVAHAENALTQLDSRASAVALGFDADASETVDLGLPRSGGTLATSDEGWLRVRVLNATTGAVDEPVVNASLGAVVYRRGETTIAYQGGGVWQSSGEGSVMVSPPELRYRDGTLTLPILSLSGDRVLSERVAVVRNGPPERKFPDRSRGLTNTLREGKVALTVHSDYYRAWGRYLERHTNAYVWYDHGNERITAVFLVLPGWASPRSGVIATSGAGELGLLGTGAYVDSYNSSNGSYFATRSNDGTVEAVGNVVTSGDSEIAGDVESGGGVEVGTSSKIDGDVRWTDYFVEKGNVTGTNESITGVAAVEPVDGFVRMSVRRIRLDSDNDETPYIRNRELSINGSSAELGSGYYYLDNLTLEGEELVLNTTDGDVMVGVRDWVKVGTRRASANLTVEGNGTVRIFVLGEHETRSRATGHPMDVNLHVAKNSNVDVPGQHSPQLRVYGPQHLVATIGGSKGKGKNASFDGVIYAPAGRTGPGKVLVMQADVYGEILTGNLTLGQYGAVHYDHALRSVPLPRSPTVARLEYMHVVVHRVRVEDR